MPFVLRVIKLYVAHKVIIRQVTVILLLFTGFNSNQIVNGRLSRHLCMS